MPAKTKEKIIRPHEIHLNCGLDVVVDMASQDWCKSCYQKIWWAVNPKTKKLISICLVGLAEWDIHPPGCEFGDKFRKRGKFLEKRIIK